MMCFHPGHFRADTKPHIRGALAAVSSGYFTALPLEQIHKRHDRNSENELCDSMNDLALPRLPRWCCDDPEMKKEYSGGLIATLHVCAVLPRSGRRS